MSENTVANSSSALVPADASIPISADQRLDDLSRILLDFKLSADKRVESLEQKLRQTQRKVGFWRTGWLIVLLAIGGGFLWLRFDQLRLMRQINGISTHTGPESEVVQRLDSLKTQVDELQQQVPVSLPERLDTTEETLFQVAQEVELLTRDQDQRRKVISVLTEALQSVAADGAPTAADLSEQPLASEAEDASQPSADQ